MTNMNSIKPLEDLIVVALLSSFTIEKNENKARTLKFSVRDERVSLISRYIQDYQLSSYISFSKSTGVITFLPNIMLERILRDWVAEDNVIALNPNQLRLNTYLLWIGIFGELSGKSVTINTKLGYQQQQSLSVIFESFFNTRLYPGEQLKIRPFAPVFIKAATANIPLNEFAIYTKLIPENEEKIVRQQLIEQEEGRALYE